MSKGNAVEQLNRRTLLRAGAAAAGLAALPTGLRAAGRRRLDDPHETIAAAAAKLRGSRDLTLRLLHPEGSWANLEPLTAAFTARTGVKFQRVTVRVDELAAHMLTTSLADQSDWDIALPATFALPDLVEAGCLLDLTQLAREHEPVSIRAGMLYDVGDYYLDRLYGYQTDGDCYLLTYNRRLLEDDAHNRAFESRYGRPLGVARTWQELDEMMAYFASSEGGGHSSTLFRTTGYAAWEWWMRFAAKGRLPFDGSMDPAIAGEHGVAALQELVAASASQYDRAGVNGLFDNWQAFREGRYFCNLGWGGSQKAMRAATSRVRDQLIIASPPGFDRGGPDRLGYFNWGWNYTVFQRCASAEIAYLFCLYAVCPQPSTLAVRADGFFDPFRAEHYADTGIRNFYGDEFMDEHRRSFEYAMPDLYLRGQTDYFDALRRHVRQAVTGESDAQTSLSTVANSWRRTSERLGKARQIEQWSSLRRRYPDALRELLR
ncbi:MAG: extracellular solute-binding protein [Planctomycetota bacterium]